MKNTSLFIFLLMLLLPACLSAGDQKPEINVNERYEVESVAFSGISESKISRSLRDEAQELVGEKYSQKSTDELAQKLREELQKYDVEVKVKRGEKPQHVKVIFQTERIRWKRFQVPIPSVVYHSKEGFSGTLEIPIKIRHSVFTFGIVSDADQLLERNAGIRLRYENRKLGTDLVQLRIDFDSYHQSFNAATEAADSGGTVRVVTGSFQDKLMIEVHDSGPGLREEARDSLFEPSISFKKHGMGLGLSISRKNALLAGGDLVAIKGALGGAGFRLVLPT
jgi:hypothetical protein